MDLEPNYETYDTHAIFDPVALLWHSTSASTYEMASKLIV